MSAIPRNIRPMYPSPSSAYSAQLAKPQNTPNMTYPLPTPIQNVQPVAQPPVPQPVASSTYPYPQYSNNFNPNPPTYPGQTPQVPFPMAGNNAHPPNSQPMNNMNGPTPVVCCIGNDSLEMFIMFYFRLIIMWLIC